MSGFDCDVLIAGGGPVGLSLAIELGHRGISALVVERNARVGQSPRAKTTNVRTREHLRRWGIADTLRAASPIPPDYPPNIVFATRMNGPVLTRFENAFNGCRVRNELYSEEAQWVPQYTLEEVLRAHAVSLPGVRVVFENELCAMTQDADGVSAEIKDLTSATTRPIRSRYLVGADGARSFVREAIGAKLQGDGPPLKNISIIFRSQELMRRQIHGDALMYWLVNPDVPGVVGPMDQHGMGYFMATKLPGDIDPATLDPVDLVRRGTGFADLDIEVLRIDPWVARSLVADFYTKGRVFLAGDACHLHPPFGGFGMNMGIGDGVDLGWKLAATLHGWGGPGLLASYQPERRPVHERTIAEANVNYAATGGQLVLDGIEQAGPAGDAARLKAGRMLQASKLREFHSLGLVLGLRYAGSPILMDDAGVPPVEETTVYTPSAYPGCLAPHAWLADGSSLYDHFGQGFTLLATNGGAAEASVFAASAGEIPLQVLAPHDTRLHDLYAARFALIRPDQHVAWRGDALPAHPRDLLERVTGHH
jgi:2-polyprenyl-6-methoxyphenol hydroxylase-like FAD-dependent oxidoreductase